MLQNCDVSDIVRNSVGFDQEWCLDSYPDVALSRLDPIKHFLSHGRAIGRGVSALRPSSADMGPLAATLKRRPDVSYCIPVMNRSADIRGTLRKNLD